MGTQTEQAPGYLLVLAFNGGAYHGFQVQKNARSVCAELQDAMEGLFGQRPTVRGCSRTDAGVHAKGFCAGFTQQTQIPAGKLPLALNSFLPPDIRVRKALPTPPGFHARYAAQAKEYRYFFHNAPVEDPFCGVYSHRVWPRLDAAAMHRAAQAFAGTHDFSAFRAAGAKPGSAVRTLHRLWVRRRGEMVELAVSGDGFLYNMVRILAGTLLEVGTGHRTGAQAAAALQSGLRGQAGATLPPEGLFLWRVYYPGFGWLGG